MRRLVTFVVRLWIAAEAQEPAWEGQVECVNSGERAHVRGAEQVVRFIKAQVGESGATRTESKTREEL